MSILAAIDYKEMRRVLESVHDSMHGFVNMGGPHVSFRDPFVFLLHANVDRLFARWQTDPAHPERLDPRTVYGSESDNAELNTAIAPWSGVPPTVRPWAPPENQQVAKLYKDPSVVTPPIYDTNFPARPRPADGWVTSWGSYRVDVFAIGHDSPMYHKSLEGSVWRPSQATWERIGGSFAGPPAVTSWGNNRLDVFGVSIRSEIDHKAWDGTGWRPSQTEWISLGGAFISPPVVTAWGNNRLDLFAIGTDSVMYHKAWTGPGWRTEWDNLGGIFISPPAVTSWGENRLDMFAIGTDSALYHRAWDGTDWRPPTWERLGGTFKGRPAVTAWGKNRLDIFAVGTDSAMYHKAWDGSAWRPSLLGWDQLGGTFKAP